ncbi:MAG TPA: methionyl-tRNA formyltransferase [Solirubrobacteraceae bacterium]|nr:methionyl-tRNA formyltransferase [Solirubrobacteraceae bacterium]
MSVVYLGTSDFAAAILERLAREPAHRPSLVVTRPDRPSGRGRRLSSPPVADTARALGLDLAQPERVNDPEAIATIGRAAAGGEGPPTVIVCAFGALISEPLLSAQEILNVHPSLLPRWRGAAPVERAIMAGDDRTGVAIMRLTAGLDEGPVCLTGEEPIGPEDTYGSLAGRLRELGGELLVRALAESPPFREQNSADITYAEKIGPADRLLDPARPAVELERTVRALHPHIGARLGLQGESMLGVIRAALPSELGAEPSVGELAEHEGRLLLGCDPGALELLEVQPPGGRPMPTDAYLRGHGLPLR